jgi:lysophospholipid acyltransferase (LPLAT)-like uncharacterized protein
VLARTVAPFLIAALVQLLGRSWRLRVVDEGGILTPDFQSRPPLIWVFWHNRLLVGAMFWVRRLQPRRGAVLISRSKDGEILAGVVRKLGGEPVRGSSSRGGATALSELARRLGNACDAWITPDGPRGPRYAVHPGAVWLAQTTGAAIVPVNVEASSCWRLKSWDGFIIPKPFARLTVTLLALHRVPAEMDAVGIEQECERLRGVLMEGTGVR